MVWDPFLYQSPSYMSQHRHGTANTGLTATDAVDRMYRQGVALTRRNSTGPPSRAAPW